jgi:hypothetical protein
MALLYFYSLPLGPLMGQINGRGEGGGRVLFPDVQSMVKGIPLTIVVVIRREGIPAAVRW